MSFEPMLYKSCASRSINDCLGMESREPKSKAFVVVSVGWYSDMQKDEPGPLLG